MSAATTPEERCVSMEAEIRILCDQLAALQSEVAHFRAREKACATMDQAEKVALVRMGQEIAAVLGLNDPPPAQIVAGVRALRTSAQDHNGEGAK